MLCVIVLTVGLQARWGSCQFQVSEDRQRTPGTQLEGTALLPLYLFIVICVHKTHTCSGSFTSITSKIELNCTRPCIILCSSSSFKKKKVFTLEIQHGWSNFTVYQKISKALHKVWPIIKNGKIWNICKSVKSRLSSPQRGLCQLWRCYRVQWLGWDGRHCIQLLLRNPQQTKALLLKTKCITPSSVVWDQKIELVFGCGSGDAPLHQAWEGLWRWRVRTNVAKYRNIL